MRRRRETSALRVRRIDWTPSRIESRPGADEAHLRSIELDRHAALLETLSGALSSDERALSRRYRKPLDGRRFAAGGEKHAAALAVEGNVEAVRCV